MKFGIKGNKLRGSIKNSKGMEVLVEILIPNIKTPLGWSVIWKFSDIGTSTEVYDYVRKEGISKFGLKEITLNRRTGVVGEIYDGERTSEELTELIKKRILKAGGKIK